MWVLQNQVASCLLTSIPAVRLHLHFDPADYLRNEIGKTIAS
jgi:hypothetical protein